MVKTVKTHAVVSRELHNRAMELLMERCADAEILLDRLLDYIDPDLLASVNYDAKAAVEKLIN